MIQPPFNFSMPILDDDKASQALQRWMRQVSLSIPLTGEGSPEGVVEALQFSLYLDVNGTTGTTQYRKMLPEIGGDRSRGWVLM